MKLSSTFSFVIAGICTASAVLSTGVIAAQEATRTSKRSIRSLGEAAGKIHLQWPADRKVTITNATIHSLASKALLTTAHPSTGNALPRTTKGSGGTTGSVPTKPEATTRIQKKIIWQRRYRSLLIHVLQLKKRLAALNTDIPRLWNEFYARDDPAYRDGVIKPRLDKELAARKKLQAQLDRANEAIPKFLEEARKNDVPPGWLREVRSSIASSVPVQNAAWPNR